MTDELKPCPFCGGKGIADKVVRGGYEYDRDDQDAYAHYIRCIACAAQGPWLKNAHGAIRMWNMRQACTVSAK